MCLNEGIASLRQNLQLDHDIGYWHMGFFGPFDQQDIVTVKFVAKSRRLPLIVVLQTI